MHLSKRNVWVGAVGVVVVLSACSGHDSHSAGSSGSSSHAGMDMPAGAPMAPTPTVAGASVVVIQGATPQFAPNAFTVKAGAPFTIQLTAVDAEHDLSVRGAEGHVHALVGQTVSGGFRIDQPGTYEFVCDQPGHADAGMRGTIAVA
ncbi:MAG: plastocyanin/azurin family copper-binding protein [Acidimicrobiia bacterium]